MIMFTRRRCRPTVVLVTVLVIYIFTYVGNTSSSTFVQMRPARLYVHSHQGIPIGRFAEPAVDAAPIQTQAAEGETIDQPKEGTISVVQGAKRTRIAWAAKETCSQLRQRVEESTGIPAAKQELALANQDLLGESGELQSQYSATGPIRTVWLTDLRTPAERGEKEKTLLDEFGTLWKLDNITVLSILVAGWAIVKDLLPILINGINDPLKDRPWT